MKLSKVFVTFLILMFTSLQLWAKGAAGPPPESSMENPLAIILMIIIGALALIIILLSWVVSGAADVFVNKWRGEKSMSTRIITVLLVLTALGSPAMAQESGNASPATAVVSAANYGGLDKMVFFSLVGVIAIELATIFYFIYNLRLLIRKEKVSTAAASAETTKKSKESLWSKLNNFRPAEQEADITLHHEYDGIRELDNRLPPWWLYGFYICIVFAAVYLWRYHVSHSAPSSKEEYELAVTKAAAEKEAYLAKAANKVDENTVVMLDAGGIAAGQAAFQTNCAACHGRQGEGGVGPNLTDEYWLHGGKINDIFKTIKYGVPEKGMRAWNEDMSPVQLAQLSSYIKSLAGTKPPNAKEQQGELYKEPDPQ
jgi:cytochrome c oxidase cbb3-type subunit 3